MLDHRAVVAFERRMEERLLASELGVQAVAIDAQPLGQHLGRRARKAMVTKHLHRLRDELLAVVGLLAPHSLLDMFACS